MLIKPKRGQIIKAADIAVISERAGRAVVGGLSQVRTSAGAIITSTAHTEVVRAKIIDDLWTAKNIAGTYWLTALATVIHPSTSGSWVDAATSEPPISVWWSAFGPVEDGFDVPVVHRNLLVAFFPDSGFHEVIDTGPVLFPVQVTGQFNDQRLAPAKFLHPVTAQPYATPTIWVFDPLEIFDVVIGQKGYALRMYDGEHNRFYLIQLKC